jgi:hypothetical protein
MMKSLCTLLIVACASGHAVAQDAVATELPPALRARQEKARAAAEAKAAREAAAAEARARRETAAAERGAARSGAAAATPGGQPAAARAPAAPAGNEVALLPVPDGASGEPTLATARVEKCADCKTATKRRVLMWPARVRAVAPESGANPDALGQRFGENVEALLKARPELQLLDRGTAADADAELTPQRARQLTADLAVQVTVERVDVAHDVRRASSGKAQQALQRAQELETEAEAALQTAAANEEEAAEALKAAQELRRQTEQTQAQMQRDAATMRRSALNLGLLTQALGVYGEAASTEKAERAVQAARNKRAEADRKFRQAHQMKEQAERATQTDLIETTRTTAAVHVSWRVVDTLSGEAVAGDTLRLNDGSSNQREVHTAAIGLPDPGAATRTARMVDSLVQASLSQLADKLPGGLDKVPFRSRIARVDRAGVVLGTGRNAGLEVGDSFAVRRADAAGGGASTLEGLIRVVEVGEQTAKAVVQQPAGKLSRGEVLEWVGVYK